MPCLLYWSTYARHVCGSRAFVSNHLIFFVGLISPNFLFPVGISRIFSTTPLIFFSPSRIFSYFPRWYFENFLNHVQNFLFVFRFVNTKVLDFRIAHTDKHTHTHTQRGKIFIFGPMVFFRILIYTYVHTHDPIRKAPPRRGQSANASCPRLVSALQALTRAETCATCATLCPLGVSPSTCSRPE